MKKKTKNKTCSRRVVDAHQSNWVDKYCPEWTKPYLKLSRLDRPIGTWLLLIPCWWGSGLALLSTSIKPSFNDFWIVTSCILGAVLMRGAGCTWNDIADQKIDSKVFRTMDRPLPSKQISNKKALLWILIQMLLSLGILFTYNFSAILLGFLAIVPVLIYPFAKRFTWWPQLFLGLAFNWGILLAFTAHFGALTPSALILYISGVFWTLFYDTIYAYQDIKDDALVGVKSTARLFGDNALYWLGGFAVATISLCISAIFLSPKNFSSMEKTTVGIGVLLFGLHLLYQLIKLNPENSTLCLKLFKSNKWAGLLLAFFMFITILYRQV